MTWSQAETLIDKYRRAAEAYATAKGLASYMDHYRRVVLARQMTIAENNGAKSAAAQERDARGSDAYVMHVNGLHEAVIGEELAKAELRAAEYMIELYRTEQASLRAERKAYNA